MRHDLTDTDVLTFVLAGCNAAEIAAYAGTSDEVAQARMDHTLAGYVVPTPALSPSDIAPVHAQVMP